MEGSILSPPSPEAKLCSNSLCPQVSKLDMKPRGPGSIFEALWLDQASCSNRQLSYRESYLSQLLSSCDSMYSTDIQGHHACVNALAFSRGEAQFLASGGDDHRVLVWKVADVIRHPKNLQPFCMNARHILNIFSLDFSCDNAFIFSGGENSELIKHDFNTHQCVSTYDHLEAVYCVAAHPSMPELVLTASEDGCVYIIDTRSPRRELGQDMVLCEGLDSYQCVAINPVEPRLVAVSNTRRGSALYDTRNRKRVVSYKGTDGPMHREDGVSVSFSGSGMQVFSMYRHHPPTLHNLWDSSAICYFSDSQGAYRNSVTMKSGCFMGQDDEFVVSGSDDFRVYIWKVPSATEIAAAREGSSSSAGIQQSTPHLVLPGHRSIVNQTRYSKVHKILVSSGVEKVAKVWSNTPLNAHHSVQRSRDPPARRVFTQTEIESIIDGTSSPVEPNDSLEEDVKVLALFDGLVDRDMERTNNPTDSDDSLSDSSALFFPFWRELPFFYDSDSSDFSGNPSSIDPPWSDYLDSDAMDEYGEHSLDSDWDCSSDVDDDEEEEADNENVGVGRIVCICNPHTHGDEVTQDLLPQNGESGHEPGTATASMAREENSQNCERDKRRSGRRRASRSFSYEMETEMVSTGSDGVAARQVSGASVNGRHGDVNGITMHNDGAVLGTTNDGHGDGSAVQLNFPLTPIEDGEASDGYPRTRSKRKKLLDLHARCNAGGGSGDFGSSYVAEDFLKEKPPSNFYASSNSSVGNSSKY